MILLDTTACSFQSVPQILWSPIVTSCAFVVLLVAQIVGKWMFSIREAEEFARIARKHKVITSCITGINPKLSHYCHFLFQYRKYRIDKHKASTRQRKQRSISWASMIRPFSSKYRRDALLESRRTVESFIRQYVITTSHDSSLKDMIRRERKWQIWQAINALALVCCLAFVLLGFLVAILPKHNNSVIATNASLIAGVAELAFFAFSYLAFQYEFKNHSEELFTSAVILYTKRTNGLATDE